MNVTRVFGFLLLIKVSGWEHTAAARGQQIRPGARFSHTRVQEERKRGLFDGEVRPEKMEKKNILIVNTTIVSSQIFIGRSNFVPTFRISG